MKKTITSIGLIALLLIFYSEGVSQKLMKTIDESKSKNFKEIVEDVEKFYKNRDKGKGSGYKQFKRWEYFNSTRLLDGKKITNISKKEIDEFLKYKRARANRRTDESEASLFSGNWKSFGPLDHQIIGNGYSDGLGRINCIAVDPSNNNIIYAGTPGGGLWKTTNGGSNWAPLTDNFSATIGVSGIAIDPLSPSSNRTIYILTGDGDQGNMKSLGVLKSTDNGNSWNNTGLSWASNQYKNGYKLMMHPTNNQILFAVTTDGIYKTINGGSSWQLKINAGSFQDMEFKPGDPNTIYAASWGSIYLSYDNGDSFSRVSSGLPSTSSRAALGVTPANPNYVYINFADGTGVYRSTDSGLNFSLRSQINMTGNQGWYNLAIAVSPTNAEEVHGGGIDCYKSIDGGATWNSTSYWVKTSAGPGNYTHADIHALDFVGSTLYCGSDGGVFKSTNNAEDWVEISYGLSITEFYKISIDPKDATRVIGGSQDNGSNILQNGMLNQWFGADGMECHVDHTNSNILYGSYQNGGLIKSTDNGQSMSYISPPSSGSGSWVTPFTMDPNNSSTLYAAYSDLWKTTNGGSTWTNISNGNLPGTVRFIAVAPSNSNIVYINIWGSPIYKTTDNGSTWTKISNGIQGTVTYMAIHPTNPDIIYVTMGNFNAGEKVFKTTNGGATWTNVSGTLPNVPANCIVLDKGSSNGVYMGNDIGVFYRDDNMSDWIPFTTGLPNTIVTEIEIHDGAKKLFAGTYGRGIWQSDLFNSTPPTNCTAKGTILREVWNNVSGTSVSDIPLNTSPSSSSQLTSFEGPLDVAENYGSRIRGYICAPTTGNYTFWISGDDNCELWLSTDSLPSNKVKVAFVSGWTGSKEWNKYPEQKSAAISLTAGGKYYVEVLHKEGGGGDNVAVGWQLPNGVQEMPIPGTRLSPVVEQSVCSGTGIVKREMWANISGTSISNIPLNTAPTSTSDLTSLEGPLDVADNYGSRIRGYICAPATGNYTFWISGDDNSELWLSTNDNPTSKVKIAFVSDWTNYREWNKYPSQKSASISLIEGGKYYFEVLHKEGGGGDNVSVGWQLPNGVQEMPIPGSRLSPFVETTTCNASGTIKLEKWINITGTTVSNIPVNTAPNTTSSLNIFEIPNNVDENYGSRISGFICPPQTGDFTFYLASDDNSELWLSTNDNPSTKVRIAYVSGWTNYREWAKYTSQQSSAVYLETGKKYYVEALHKEGTGGDNLSIGWKLPSGVSELPIPGTYLSPYGTVAIGPSIEESSEEFLRREFSEENTVKIYPVPTDNLLYVELLSNYSEEAIINVYNGLSLPLLNLNYPIEKGNNLLTIPTESLSIGLYYITIKRGNNIIKRRIEIVK